MVATKERNSLFLKSKFDGNEVSEFAIGRQVGRDWDILFDDEGVSRVQALYCDNKDKVRKWKLDHFRWGR